MTVKVEFRYIVSLLAPFQREFSCNFEIIKINIFRKLLVSISLIFEEKTSDQLLSLFSLIPSVLTLVMVLVILMMATMMLMMKRTGKRANQEWVLFGLRVVVPPMGEDVSRSQRGLSSAPPS